METPSDLVFKFIDNNYTKIKYHTYITKHEYYKKVTEFCVKEEKEKCFRGIKKSYNNDDYSVRIEKYNFNPNTISMTHKGKTISMNLETFLSYSNGLKAEDLFD